MEKGWQPHRIEPTASDIDPDRHWRTLARLPLAVDELLEQSGGKVVDTVPPHVLQRVEHGRLAGAGHAGHQEQARQRLGAGGHRQSFKPRRSSASATFDGAEAVMASTL